MIPHNDDEDRASSVEAAVDDASDVQRSEADATTLAGLPTPDTEKLLKFSPPTETHPVDRLGRQISEMSLNQASMPAQQTTGADCPGREPQTVVGDTKSSPGPQATAASRPDAAEDSANGNNSPAQSVPEQAPGSSPDQSAERKPMRASLAELDSASKVVMAYRTNEWAKHLERAEKPSLDDIRLLQRQQSKSTAPTEQVAPVNVSDLRQTPLSAEPAPALSSPKLDTASNHRFTSRSSSSQSQESLSRSPLQQQRPHQLRHSSSLQKAQAPITIQEDIPSTTFPQRPNFNAIPTANTLLSHRESLLQQRPTSVSLNRVPPFQDDDDSTPLSHRRASLLKNHANTQRRISSSPPNIPNNPYHNLNKTNGLSNNTHDSQTLQLRQSQLLAQKRRSDQNLLEKEREKGRKEREADDMWRRQGNGMEERHREAMRKMQAGVGG